MEETGEEEIAVNIHDGPQGADNHHNGIMGRW